VRNVYEREMSAYGSDARFKNRRAIETRSKLTEHGT
jgi:hypothetical protein